MKQRAGLEKARRLASKRRVHPEWIAADLLERRIAAEDS
jgi:hypothetical protein